MLEGFRLRTELGAVPPVVAVTTQARMPCDKVCVDVADIWVRVVQDNKIEIKERND